MVVHSTACGPWARAHDQCVLQRVWHNKFMWHTSLFIALSALYAIRQCLQIYTVRQVTMGMLYSYPRLLRTKSETAGCLQRGTKPLFEGNRTPSVYPGPPITAWSKRLTAEYFLQRGTIVGRAVATACSRLRAWLGPCCYILDIETMCMSMSHA